MRPKNEIRYFASISAVITILFLLVLSLSGCEKYFIFNDEVIEQKKDSPSVTDSVRCMVTPVDGRVGNGGEILQMPSLTLRVVYGAQLLYTVNYSIDGGQIRTIEGIRLQSDCKLDCSGYMEEGTHSVTGVITNGVGRNKFTASYSMTIQTNN